MLSLDRDNLVDALKKYGIRFLAGGDESTREMSPPDLIRALAEHRDARLHLALTSLFLAHPDLSACVPEIVDSLTEKARIELQARYMAAVYLQRMWKTRLGYYLGNFRELPDYFSAALRLPSADERFGKAGLDALGEWHAQQSEFSYNHLASYEKALELLIGQLKVESRQYEFASSR
ncbi:MAG: hypothetical protein HY070_07230 [Chloroflexi bacterium]|nr:hypothetical protein [Chloroflexota bacterium]